MNEDTTFFQLAGKQATSNLYSTADGFSFYRYKRNDMANYFRCTKYKSGCGMRATQYTGSNEVYFSGYHCHPADPEDVPYRIARRALVREARRLEISSFQDIFNDPRHIEGEFADQLTMRRLQPAMNRERLKILPTCRNFGELVEVLQNPLYRCVTAIGEDTLFRGSARTQDGSLVAVFVGKTCAGFLSILPNVHITTSTALVCDERYTICTVSGRWYSHAVAVAWCVLEAASLEAFDAAFRILRSSLVSWQFRNATCGSDIVARAFSSTFNVHVDPSLFDYIRDLKEFLKGTWTLEAIRELPHLNTIIKLCSSLPLLPRDVLQVGLNIISAEVQKYGPAEMPKFQGLFSLILDHWLNNPRFCVCGSSERTDFGREELKLQLEQKIGGRNANFYCITKFMVSSTVKSIEEIKAAAQGLRRRSNVVRPPFSEDNDIVVLLQQLVRSAFSKDATVRNLMNVCGEKLSFLFV